jgi:hypothetical protein
MGRAIADLERDILALSSEDKRELLDVLIAELDGPDAELADLARQFVAAVERTDRSLQATINRLEGLDAELERAADEVRERVRASAEGWPFPPA